jgi:NitT/TauT family transport system permease protein
MTTNTIRGKTGSDLEAAIDTRGNQRARWVPAAVGAASVVLLIVVWQLYASLFHISTLVLASPSDIVSSLRSYISSGNLWPDLWESGKEFFLGYLIAVVVGVIVGLLAGWYRRLGYILAPFIWFFLSVPVISLISLIVIWTGFGIEPKVIIVTLSSFFPIVVNTMTGVRTLDKRLIRLERSYCANDFQIFRTLALPSVVPYSLAGMRIGVGHAIAAVYVAEWGAAANLGIGHMMVVAGNQLDTARVFVGFAFFGIAGIVVTMLIGLLQRQIHQESSS